MTEPLITFLIDDDIDDQEIFSFLMEETFPDSQCVFANDGIHGLEKMQDTTFLPGLIFIDINMPRMGGIEFLEEIKKIKRVQDVPAYMYSTSAEPSIIEQCMRLGATGFLTKRTNTDEAKQDLKKIITDLNRIR